MQYVLRRNEGDDDDGDDHDDDDDHHHHHHHIDDGIGGGGGGDDDEILISVSKVFILTSKKLVGNTFVLNMKHLAQTNRHLFFYIPTDIACCSRRTKNSLREESIEMSSNSHPSTSGSYYNSIQLLDEPHSGNRLTTKGQDTYDDVHLDEATYYNDVNPKQESTYQEIKNETCYQPLDLNRQVDYESLGQFAWQADDHYQPLNTTGKHVYGAPSASPPKIRK